MIDDLLDLALQDPARAVTTARSALESGADPSVRSIAHQALGIVYRARGQLAEAEVELRRGLRAARASGSRDREADVRATYGITLAFAGRTGAGLTQLRRAVAEAGHGETGAKVRLRLAAVLAELGRNEEARAELTVALEGFVVAGNAGWEAKARVWLGHLELRIGNVAAAERQIEAALPLLVSDGVELDRLAALENLAEIAVARGDLAEGLRMYGVAAAGYRDAGEQPRFELVRLHSAAYLAAGLASSAVDLLDAFPASTLHPMERAEYHLVRSSALLAAGQAAEAGASARTARSLFARQGRKWYVRRARLEAVRANFLIADGKVGAADAREVARLLHEEGADEAALALTLAGRVSSRVERHELWAAASSYATRPNGLVRAAARLAGALEREGADDRAGVLRSCAAGLDALDEHRRLLGSSELRALATTHGRELTTIALRHAAHDPRTLLRWSERTRATALAQPPATSDAATIPESLAALRDNGRQLAEARQAGEPTEHLEKERLRLERAVRSEHHTLSTTEEAQRPASAEEVVAGVGDGCLVELVDVDGVLHVLVVHDGRVRRRVAGATAEVADLLAPTAMLLRRAARGRPSSLEDLGRRLEATILGDAARLIPDGPVVLAPTARLHGLPWALLPALADRPFSVVPSAGQWLRAQQVRRPRARRTVLVAGPALASGGAEVPVLARRLDGAELLDGGDATVERVLGRLGGADLVHLAAHGRFRADSPLFSALDLADGPLTVHDLERVPRAPYRVVLSACESGVLAPVGAEELLGLAAALFSLGSAGLVCSVAEVNDDATAELMVGLHDGLAQGSDPAAALLAVRQHATDPVVAATAASFVALGV